MTFDTAFISHITHPYTAYTGHTNTWHCISHGSTTISSPFDSKFSVERSNKYKHNNPKNIALIIKIIIWASIYTSMTLQEGWLLMHNI